MNSSQLYAALLFLLLTGATAGIILHARDHQHLGAAGVVTRPLSAARPGARNLEVVLPANLPGYTAQVTPQAETVINALPDDTSFGRCVYTAPDGFQCCANVVLMGTDRSSIHKPQICLTAQGWQIDDAASRQEMIPMTKPVPYQMPVMHLVASLQAKSQGETRLLRGVYVYWFVDGHQITASHMDRMIWTARDMLFTGVLDRFAYISYFAICPPGREAEAYQHMTRVIQDTVPQFQLVPKAGPAVAVNQP